MFFKVNYVANSTHGEKTLGRQRAMLSPPRLHASWVCFHTGAFRLKLQQARMHQMNAWTEGGRFNR